MKVLLINGSPHERGCTYTALDEIRSQLAKRGVDSEILWLGKEPIMSCQGCGACAKMGKGRCVYNDVVNTAIEKMETIDGIIVGSPVHYSGPSAQVCAFMDRLFYSAGERLQYKPAAAVVSCRRAGSTAALDRLIKYFTINNMPLVSSQYWAQVHGTNPDEVRQDAKGMQTMRTLGENMAWLLRCIEAGKAAGVPAPAQEPRARTNFIR